MSTLPQDNTPLPQYYKTPLQSRTWQVKHKVGGWGEETHGKRLTCVRLLNQARDDGLVFGRRELILGHLLLLFLVTCLHTHTYTPALLPLKLGTDWKLLCDCQHWQIPCLTVLLFVCFFCLSLNSVCLFYVCVSVCGPVRASAEDWTKLLWSMLGGCGAPAAVALRVLIKDKKRKDKKDFSSL